MRNARVLISFCNLASPAATSLAMLNGGTPPVAVELGGDGARVWSGVGLARSGGFVYHLYFRPEVRVAALDARTLELVADSPLPEVDDPHSACLYRGRLVVASTGTDEVLSYELAGHRPRHPQVVWSPTGAGHDVHHVNSVVDIGGELWCCAFGPKAGEGWDTARSGYVYNISRGSVAVSGVGHPHSLRYHRGRIYYCDSPRSRVMRLDGTPVAQAQGYVRGLAFAGDSVLVGSSVGRSRSKSSGVVHNPADEGEPTGSCGLSVFDLRSGQLAEWIDLSSFGDEVYDILTV